MNRWEQEEAEQWEQEAAEQEAAEQQAYEAQMQAMYDEQQREQQTTEQITWLQAEIDAIRAENERLRADLDALAGAVGQACVAASLSDGETLTDPMQHIIVSTVTRLRAEALTQREQERAAVVAWLREVADTMNHNGDKCCGRVEDLASAVERGEHRREERT